MKEILILAAATLGCWIFYFYEKNKENKENKENKNMSLYYQSLNFKVLVLAIAGTLSVLIILVKRIIV